MFTPGRCKKTRSGFCAVEAVWGVTAWGEAAAVSGIHELNEVREAAEVLFNAIKIHRTVAVVISGRRPPARPLVIGSVFLQVIEVIYVVIPGRKPKRGDAKFLQVRQPGSHAGKIAAVIMAWLGAVI